MKKLSTEKRFEVEQALRCGLTGWDIKEKTGVSLSTISKIRQEEAKKGFDIYHVPGKLSKYIN